MADISLKAGMVFATANPMLLGKAINGIQWLWSSDNESRYSHAGIIIDSNGTTFEALWTVKSQNIFEAYKGKKVIIAQPHATESKIRIELTKLISAHKGDWYPFWRLGLHIIPPLAKIGLLDKLVCSELTAKYLYMIGVRHSKYKGTNPDTLVDEWRNWKAYDIVFEGGLE